MATHFSGCKFSRAVEFSSHSNRYFAREPRLFFTSVKNPSEKFLLRRKILEPISDLIFFLLNFHDFLSHFQLFYRETTSEPVGESVLVKGRLGPVLKCADIRLSDMYVCVLN